MEKFRIFISQLVTSILVVFLVIWIGFVLVIKIDLINRLSHIGFNYESIGAVIVGVVIAYFGFMLMKIPLWLIRRPKTNYTIEKRKAAKKINMGTIENIPQNAR